MSAPREVVVVALDQERLLAAGAAVDKGSVRVHAWHSAPVPKELDLRDGAAAGAWLGEELKKAGLGRSRLVFAASRGEVVIKRMRLPAPVGVGERELAGMVRLQMARQLTVPLEDTAIDYIPIGAPAPGNGKPGEKSPPSLSVLAAALPGDRLRWYQEVARAAGCRLDRIGLRSAGLAAMLSDVAHRHSGPVLGIGVGISSVEFIVVEGGSLLFARSSETGPPGAPGEPDAALVARIAIEAKRTWMSYRVSDESAVVDALIVAGDGALAREVAERCGEALEMPAKLAEPGRAVEMPKGIPDLERLAAVPLVGLLLESALERPALDFAKPRRGADPGAARRQRVLVAALGLIVLVGGAWVYDSVQLGALDRKLKEAQTRGQELRTEYHAYIRDDARLEHLKQWTGAGVDWISHTRWLTDQMPDPRQAQLDQLSGRLKADVVYTPKAGGAYDDQGWRLSQAASFSLAGKVKRRELADDFRDRLVNSQVFRVESKGPDVPDRFALELSTKLASPEESGRAPPSSPSPPPGAKPGGAQ